MPSFLHLDRQDVFLNAIHVQENPHRQSRRDRRAHRARLPRNGASSPVAVFSEADRASLHVRLADEAYPIGPAPSRESYLRIDKMMEVARRAGCDALHPGYGFLAENPALRKRLRRRRGVTFVGPSAEAMERLGAKTAARQLAHEAGVPMVPGVRASRSRASRTPKRSPAKSATRLAQSGGRRRRQGHAHRWQARRNAAAWRDAGSEALNAFGDGRAVHRKISGSPAPHRNPDFRRLARQHRLSGRARMLRAAPPSESDRGGAFAACVTPELRAKMGEAAVRLARAAGYSNAGTAEFLVDAARNSIFSR